MCARRALLVCLSLFDEVNLLLNLVVHGRNLRLVLLLQLLALGFERRRELNDECT